MEHVELVERIRTVAQRFDTMELSERKAALQGVIERIDCDARMEPVVRFRFRY